MHNEWLQTIGNMYWFFMLAAYPLTVREGYFDIATSKLVFFLTLSAIFILSNVVIRSFNKFKNKESFGVATLPKQEFILFCATFICIFITFLKNGDYLLSSWGPGETHTSIIFLSLILLSYLFIRITPFDKKIFSIWAVVGVTLVSLIAILQHFGLDPGNLFGAVSPYANPQTFMTTMSNRDLVGFYLVIMFPFCFYLTTVPKWSILGFIGVITNGCAIFICDTDAALLCFGFEMVLMVFICIDKPEFARTFPICLVGLGLSLTVTGYLENKIENTLELSYIHRLLITPKMGIAVIILSIILYAILKRHSPKIVKYIALAMLITLSLYPVYIAAYTLYRNSMPKGKKLPFDSFLYFNDKWGTTRGRLTRISLAMFKESDFFTKLFGYGVHGYPMHYYEYCKAHNEAAALKLAYYDAHNMYLHYLIEYGICGLVTACSLFVYRVRAMLISQDDDCFFKIKAIALITAMINAIFLFCNNINMAFIPALL